MQSWPKEHYSDMTPRPRPSHGCRRGGAERPSGYRAPISGRSGRLENVLIVYATRWSSPINNRWWSREHLAGNWGLFQSICSFVPSHGPPCSGRGRERTAGPAVRRPRSAVSREETPARNSGRHAQPPFRAAPPPKDTTIASCVSRAEECCAAGAGRTPVPPHALSPTRFWHTRTCSAEESPPHTIGRQRAIAQPQRAVTGRSGVHLHRLYSDHPSSTTRL